MKLSKSEFKKLRNTMYKAAGELGTLAELKESFELANAYTHYCNALDFIDALGYKLGYLNPETNEDIE